MTSAPVILLAEDSPDDERLTIRAVQASGVSCEVIVQRDGRAAMAFLLDEARPLPDLVVLDHGLPFANGLDVLRQLRESERTRLLPVVILSGMTSEGSVNALYRTGANSCVAKPNDSQQYSEHVGLIVRYWLTVNRPA